MSMGGRKNRALALCASALFAFATLLCPTAGAQQSESIELVDLEQHVRNIATYTSASVVTVVSIHSFPEGRDGSADGATGESETEGTGGLLEATVGSGIVINENGDIITTVSVIGAGGEYQITTARGEVWSAELVGCDRGSRLCLLRSGAKNLRPIKMGSAKDIGSGTMLIIVGRAYGNLPTVSFGAMNERHPWKGTEDGGLISMSAPVYPGNNGGAVVNFKGELIGVVSGTLGGFESEEGESVMRVPPEMPDIATPAQDSQMSFAIPVEALVEALPQLESGGTDKSAYFGVRVASIPDAGTEDGVVISAVVPESPADEAGLRANDVIYSYDGTGVTSAEQLIELVRRSLPGSGLDVVYMRDGDLRTTKVVLREISPYELKLVEKKMTRGASAQR